MRRAILAVTVLIVSVGLAQAGTRADLSGDAVVDFATTMDMPFMAVGNVGNAGEWSGNSYGGSGPDRICGAVDYFYRMGKFEVTVGQYTEFLNAVAATDTYELYNANMDTAVYEYGCNIKRAGAPGSYTYSVEPDWTDRPVNYVNWGDAARFCNWLTNGMPTGAQDLTTTEDGSYFLNGAITRTALMAITRKTVAQGGRYYIPAEDEWYKAAYHRNDGVTGNYFDYPTSTDSVPSNVLTDPDPGNNATHDDAGNTIGRPYWRTEVGEFENSESPYGTFDQGGNVHEWNEAVIYDGASRGTRGASFFQSSYALSASNRLNADPTNDHYYIGFRVAEVPEPATLGMLSLGGLTLLRRRKRK